MKRIYVHAYLAGNLGDDLFVEILCRRYPEVRFYVLADEIYKVRFGKLKNCIVCAPGDRRVRWVNGLCKRAGIENGMLRAMVRCLDGVIHIGGSAFTQHFDDWSAFFNYDVYLAEKSRRMYLIGANFGPYTDEEYPRKYHALFCKYTGICFRDSDSFALFRDIPHVAWAPDVVFQYTKERAPKKQKKIVVAPIELENRGGKYSIREYEEPYVQFHVQMIRALIKRGYQISLTAFCESQGDCSMIGKISRELTGQEQKQLYCVAYTTDTEAVLREFEEAEGVIGSRFHSSILGFVNHCRVLSVIYDQKTEHVLEDLGHTMKVKLEELSRINAGELADRFLETEPLDVSGMKEASEGQFRYADMFLKQ